MVAQNFVQRTYLVDGREVVCRFSTPEPDGDEFRCRYEIGWRDGAQWRNVYGADGVQALLLAMKTAHSDLLVAREQDKSEVTWGVRRHLGLPISDAAGEWQVDDIRLRAAEGRRGR